MTRQEFRQKRLDNAKAIIDNKLDWWALQMGDGEFVCINCARSNWDLIVKATLSGEPDGWDLHDANYAVGAKCEQCGTTI